MILSVFAGGEMSLGVLTTPDQRDALLCYSLPFLISLGGKKPPSER